MFAIGAHLLLRDCDVADGPTMVVPGSHRSGRLAPAPLLVVHGDADRYFPLDHARWLVEAARGPVELWVESGFGHAEAAATPELVERVAAWVLHQGVLHQAGGPAPAPH